MHDPRINTLAAVAVIALFGIGALVMVERAIMQIDWALVSMDDATLLTKTQ